MPAGGGSGARAHPPPPPSEGGGSSSCRGALPVALGLQESERSEDSGTFLTSSLPSLRTSPHLTPIQRGKPRTYFLVICCDALYMQLPQAARWAGEERGQVGAQ